ncbi:MAG: hypothetical protein GEV08_25705 [Acidimicrobiia bacterium]|nr:hypothetical protein [Acidimicrobiia bacterium]
MGRRPRRRRRPPGARTGPRGPGRRAAGHTRRAGRTCRPLGAGSGTGAGARAGRSRRGGGAGRGDLRPGAPSPPGRPGPPGAGQPSRALVPDLVRGRGPPALPKGDTDHGGVPVTEPWVGTVSSLAPLVERHVAEAERARRPHPEVSAALVERGLFKLWVPRDHGGTELGLPASLAVFEAAARLDGSFGWTVAIGAGGGLFGGFLEPTAAAEVFGPRDALVAGSGAPGGTADERAGGYRVSGRWRFASGAHAATCFTANCVVHRRGEPVLDASGRRVVRAVAVPPAAVEVLDTWDPIGLRGTDSHDMAIAGRDVTLPFTFSVFDPPHQPGPLYRYPFMAIAEASFAALVLGLARRGLDLFTALAEHKVPYGFEAPLATMAEVDRRLAEAGGRLDAARAALGDAVGPTWATVAAGGVPSAASTALVGRAARGCARAGDRAVGALVEVAGMSVLPMASPFGRAWRDLHALLAHGVFSPLRDATPET